jgi:hypothetical protein
MGRSIVAVLQQPPLLPALSVNIWSTLGQTLTVTGCGVDRAAAGGRC